jgi:transposase-like protein
MKNRANKRTKKQTESCHSQRTLRLSAVIERNLFGFLMQEGLKALDAFLERDMERVCGERGKRKGEHQATRWGSAEGRLVLGGRRVKVQRPRARKEGEEVELPTWSQFSDEDPLDERTMEQMVLGVSTRNYERSLEEVPDDMDPHGASKSAASRRFVEMTQAQVEEWLSRDLSKLEIVSIMIDGIEVAGQAIIVALGIDEFGRKHPLGLWQGATENSTVCEALLNNLIERGLDGQGRYLFVIDGAKALRKSIRTIFGERGVVQRCQQHKLRNVLAHVPKALETSVRQAIQEAYRSRSKTTAKRKLVALSDSLESDYPDASASLREGLDETLTVKDWALPVVLERTLSTTNPIENLNGSIRRVTRNVKRWRDGSMIRRWVAAGVLEAERGFRRLRGCKGMPDLIKAIRGAEQTTLVDQEATAA